MVVFVWDEVTTAQGDFYPARRHFERFWLAVDVPTWVSELPDTAPLSFLMLIAQKLAGQGLCWQVPAGRQSVHPCDNSDGFTSAWNNTT